MSEINKFYQKIKTLNNTDNQLSESIRKIIKNEIKILFPNLNTRDLTLLNDLSIYLINFIRERILNGIPDNLVLDQLTQNNKRDIKAIVLLILPFISDKNNYHRFKIIYDLNQIIFYDLSRDKISKDFLEIPIDDTLKNQFRVSNFGIGLINEDNDTILKLVDKNNDRLIDKMIFNNFIGLTDSIKKINGKLYINWINIAPILESNYKETSIYKNSIGNIDKLLSTSNESEFHRNYKGLWIGDYFNVIRLGYYQNIKKIKWLIYTNGNKYFIQTLEPIFKINLMISNKYQNYDSLTDSDQISIEKEFKKLLISDKDFDIKKTILIFLVNNFKYKYIIQKNTKVKKFIIENIEDESSSDDFSKSVRNKLNNFTNDEVTEGLREIGINYVWDFINNSIDLFKDTIYGSFIINNNKVDQNYQNIFINGDDTGISLKNIYNIAKLLSHGKDNFNLFFGYFVSLSDIQKAEFYNKFSSNSDNSWIKLDKNIKRENPENPNLRRNEIINGWKKYKNDFIFIYLLRKGLLSEFKVDTEITNTDNLPSGYNSKNKKIENLMKNKFKKNKNWEDAYYFLNNKKFSELENIRVEKPIVKIQEKTYFEYTASDQKWFKFYAMDWISQISFFHTYIYHQVMYITGATGQGKSTQVPKLLLYSLKMIDYKEDGKIICTQPRIPPTIENAETISSQLGLPIIQPNFNNTDKYNTNNFVVQYKYQQDSHIIDSNKFSLRIVTDGTLFIELKNNMIMKEIIPTDNKKNFTYGDENTYDILIVDEAHEHNRNMDLILTMARNSIYCNNSLKLIIISATMDDDEPIYRSYFKDINENLMFPIKNLIKNIFDDEDKFLVPQTYLMDRRYDISPPGMSTQYKIEENYLDIDDNWKESQKESHKKVIEICNQTLDGEILLFSIGQKEILESVEKLNKVLPSDVIALPYFGKINSKYKDIIQKIDKNISKIKNKKNNIHLEWGEDYIQDNSVPEGIYKRAVIVATNVAEASVTIPRLKYVVDNGYAKEANFDEVDNKEVFTIEKISEASRIQRRGRVGRIADGFVYYMYPRNARESIKPKYKINQQKISEIYTQLSSLYSNDENLVFPAFFDPHNNSENYYKRFFQDDAMATSAVDTEAEVWVKKMENQKFFTETNLNKIVYNQYIFEFIFENIDQYFPDIYPTDQPTYVISFQDGYQFEQLIDSNCNFYLIHPRENFIIRNSANKLIKKIKKDGTIKQVTQLDKTYYESIFDLLLINFQICKFKNEDKYLYCKTLLGEKFEDLKNRLLGIVDSEELIFTLMYSYGLGIIDEVVMIISLLKSCNYSVKKLAETILENDKPKRNFNKLKEKYKSNNSDIESLFKIVIQLKFYFEDLAIFNLDARNNIYNKLEIEFKEIVSKFKKALDKNFDLYNPPTDIKEEWNLLNKINREGKLGNKLGFLKWLSKSKKVVKLITDNLNQNSNRINKFCKNNGLDSKIINSFFINYFEIKNNIFTIDKNEDFNILEKNPFLWIDKFKNRFNTINFDLNVTNKVEKAFIFGFCKNTCLKFDSFGNYHPVISITQKYYIDSKDSFLNNFSNSITYLNLSLDYKLKIIINVNPKILSECNPLYFNKINFKNFKMISVNYKLEKVLFEVYECYYQIFLDLLKNINNIDNMVFYENYQSSPDFDLNLYKYVDYVKNQFNLLE